MKFLVTGVGGQLDFDVMQELMSRGYECIGSDFYPTCDKIDAPYIPLDITNQVAVDAVVSEEKPDVVVHCAAWTSVDAA